ncbi:MAG: 50S ribosomal protein L18 [Spirochaetes bacterium RBG_16_49_21]|nr:MAG: 50S ribosomal protein L18 [Spirochaetes bacterium RBG_16_49_21]
MDKIAVKKKRLLRRRYLIKKKIRMHKGALRLCISRSSRNLYAQIIDDEKQHTLVALSTLAKEFPTKKNRGNTIAAKELGKLLTLKAVNAGITEVVFDRNGYKYHGKVKAFADAARENGLKF